MASVRDSREECGGSSKAEIIYGGRGPPWKIGGAGGGKGTRDGVCLVDQIVLRRRLRAVVARRNRPNAAKLHLNSALLLSSTDSHSYLSLPLPSFFPSLLSPRQPLPFLTYLIPSLPRSLTSTSPVFVDPHDPSQPLVDAHTPCPASLTTASPN